MCAHAGRPRGLPAECGSAVESEGLNDVIWETSTHLGEVSQGLTLATWVVAKSSVPLSHAVPSIAPFGDCLGSNHGFAT